MRSPNSPNNTYYITSPKIPSFNVSASLQTEGLPMLVMELELEATHH